SGRGRQLCALEWLPPRRAGRLGRSCCPKVEPKVWEFSEKGTTTRRRAPLKFSFSREPSRARVQSSLWSGDCGQEVERLHPTQWPEAGGLGRPPRRSRAQEVLGSRGSCAFGAAAAAPEPGTLATHPRRLGFLSPGRRAPTPPLSAPPQLHGGKKEVRV
ncbi:hypothetical protein MC885_008529, partial [Smutsia gigantea]